MPCKDNAGYLACYRCGGGSEDGPGTGPLGEDDESHAAGTGVLGEFQAEGMRACGKILQAADALQGAYDASVLEAVAAIFAVEDVGGVGGIDQRGVEIAL